MRAGARALSSSGLPAQPVAGARVLQNVHDCLRASAAAAGHNSEGILIGGLSVFPERVRLHQRFHPLLDGIAGRDLLAAEHYRAEWLAEAANAVHHELGANAIISRMGLPRPKACR